MKKGFTLVELLGVLVIISLVSLIVTSKISELFQKKQLEASEAFKETIFFATRQYITNNEYSFNTGAAFYCVTIGTLVEQGELVDPVVDVTTGNIIDYDTSVEVTVDENNNYQFNYNTDRCHQIDITAPIISVQRSVSVDKMSVTLVVKAVDESPLADFPYSFDNGATWQASNEIIVTSSYNNTIKVKDKVNNVGSFDYNISKLTINANGGIISGLDEVSIYWLEDGETKNIPTPIKVGYSFTNWTKVGDSTISGNSFTMGTEETSLTANWSINSYTLTVNANGGSFSGDTPQTITYGTSVTIANPIRTNYTFTGWTVSGTGSSISGTTFTMGSANASLTANWTINAYTLTVNANGGSWSGTTPQSLITGATSSIVNPTRSDYVFTGWTVSGIGSSISGTTFTMGSANTTLTANWLTLSSMYSYTGVSTLINDGSGNWRIKFLTSGTFTPFVNLTIDVFLVGGGGGSNDDYTWSGGGGGGYTRTEKLICLTSNSSYYITVGEGGAPGANGNSSGAFGYSVSGGEKASCNGGSGGSGGGTGACVTNCGGGDGGSDGSHGDDNCGDGGYGQGSTTREFGESWGELYAGGGGGRGSCCFSGLGGEGGGGASGVYGTANTGGGGGSYAGGGSGIVIIRNHR